MSDQLNLTGFSVDSAGNCVPRSLAPTVRKRRYTTQTANFSATGAEDIIGYTALAAARTVTLPLAASVEDGTELDLRDWANNAATNNLNIAASGSDTIVGPTAIAANGGRMLAVSDGVSKWYTT